LLLSATSDRRARAVTRATGRRSLFARDGSALVVGVTRPGRIQERAARHSARSQLVLSSNAISADAGYRSPRESKRRGPAIGDEQVGSVLAARVSVPSVTLPTGCLLSLEKLHQDP